MAVTIVRLPGAGTYEYDSGPTQLASHVINHNLGFKPNVSLTIRGTNTPLVGVPVHHSANQLEIILNSPQAIIARLS
jgi:hypothetical protein